MQLVALVYNAGSPLATTTGVQARCSSQDADVVNVTCISNWKQLLELFHKENPAFVVGRASMLILFNVRTFAQDTTTGNTSTIPSSDSKCCTLNDSMDECRVMVIFVQSIFGAYPPPLLLALGGVMTAQTLSSYEKVLQNSLNEICWAPQIPFCHGTFGIDIIRDFVTKVRYIYIHICWILDSLKHVM